MNLSILNTVIQEFILLNLDSDVAKILLQNSKFEKVSNIEIVEQIEAKRKCRKKLPTWYSTEQIYYPNKLNIEQTSSEITANYKSGIVAGNSLVDLTGGFGVDAYYFSKHIDSITHVEVNAELSDTSRHNFTQLKANNIRCYAVDGLIHLNKTKQIYDWIYIDPSRRHDIKGKVFFLKDCLPDVPKHLDVLFEHSNNIMIKTSPLLDISAVLTELHSVKDIHIVALNGEVKELLWILEKSYSGKISIITANIKKDKTDEFSFEIQEETMALASFSQPLTYLYEPNAAILKSGAFKLISKKLGLSKLHVNTHLYTSDQLIDFPGRRFKIDRILPYNKKLLREEFVNNKANISIRNFPESVDHLKKKFKLKDGGSSYLFFTTDITNKKIVLVCSSS